MARFGTDSDSSLHRRADGTPARVACLVLAGNAADRRDVLAQRRVELARAGLEGGDHAPRGLVEEDADEALQELRAELEVDVEVDERASPRKLRAGRHRLEDPVVVEMLERPVGVAHVDAPSAVEPDMRGEALADHPEADHEVGDDLALRAAADARGEAPGQELRIALDLRDEVEELLGRIGQQPLLGMRRHGARARLSARAWRRARPSGAGNPRPRGRTSA